MDGSNSIMRPLPDSDIDFLISVVAPGGIDKPRISSSSRRLFSRREMDIGMMIWYEETHPREVNAYVDEKDCR